MTRQTRNVSLVVLLLAVLGVLGARWWRAPHRVAREGLTASGGDLVVSIRAEPGTFNRFASRSQATDLVTTLTQAKLVRINKQTQEVEPWLAEHWTRSDDGLRYTLVLRREVVFSDGQPFTSADVLFSFRAAYDERTGGPLGDSLQVGGKPLEVSAPDSATIVVTFPSPFGPGLRLLDNLPIVPRHKLESALKAGTFAKAWGTSTPPAEIVGLGPFVLNQYQPGQRLVFVRNPHYWRRDSAGGPLPYLDRITLEVVPDQDAELLRLEAGQIDMTSDGIRPEDYAPIKRAADAGSVRLLDLGVGLVADSFWLNLKPDAYGNDTRGEWMQREELRRAISLAVDRHRFAETVFLGAGVPVFGPETPANRKWYAPEVGNAAHDVEQARALLASIGLTDRNGDGVLEDATNSPARFTVITVKGNSALERGAAVVRDELKNVGLILDVVALDQPAVIQRFLSGTYDAVYFPVVPTDTDPAVNLDFWLSSGSAHVWNLGQAAPSTEWERQIDELMARQVASSDDAERKRLFDQVQRIFVDHQPIIYFVAPRVYVATSSRVTNLSPAVSRPYLLWSPDTIAVSAASRTQ